MSKNREDKGLNLRDYLNQIVESEIDKFNAFIEWTEADKIEFKALLDELKSPYDKNAESTKVKGDRLENLVEFIIKKTYFYEIFKNVHTETNEIDEVIVFSDRGKQALNSFNLSRQLIPICDDLFLGECKNYKDNLSVTYVGKFYSLMTVTGISFGIIFTQKGLTGNSEGYRDAYGLTKVLRMVAKSKNPDIDFNILTFTLEDYEQMLDGKTFFDLVKAKMLEMQLASNYKKFLQDNKHDAEKQISDIIKQVE